MANWHFHQPADGHGLPHGPLNAIVAPRPIGWISMISATGVRNLECRVMLEEGVYRTARARPVTRGGGPAGYFATRQDALFRIRRPG